MNKSPGGTQRTGGTRSPGLPLLTLLNGAVLLALLFCAARLILYILALRRGDEDPALLSHIQWAVYGGVALGILSLYRFFAGLWFSLRRRRPLLLLSSFGFLALGVLGTLMASILSFLRSLAGGTI